MATAELINPLPPAPNLPGLTTVDPRNPTEMGFPPMLPYEIAMQVDTPARICAAYGLTKAQFAALVHHPVFIKAYREAVEALKVDGMSFKVKARLQAEAYLDTAFKMAQNPGTSDAVRADLIKNTVRWAGYDAKAADVGQGSSFNIMINLG
jgi:hypothetical protein